VYKEKRGEIKASKDSSSWLIRSRTQSEDKIERFEQEASESKARNQQQRGGDRRGKQAIPSWLSKQMMQKRNGGRKQACVGEEGGGKRTYPTRGGQPSYSNKKRQKGAGAKNLPGLAPRVERKKEKQPARKTTAAAGSTHRCI